MQRGGDVGIVLLDVFPQRRLFGTGCAFARSKSVEDLAVEVEVVVPALLRFRFADELGATRAASISR